MNGKFGWQEAEVLNALTDGVARLGRDWTVQYVNRAGLEMLGSHNNPVGKDHWKTFPDMVYEGSPFVENYYRTMDTGEKTQFFTFYGEPLNLWLEIRVNPASDGIIVFFRNVTVQHQQREERLSLIHHLQVSRDRLRTAQHAGKIASWEWDFATNTLAWDEASSWVYGRPPSEMIGYDQILDYIHVEDRAKVETALRPAVEGTGDYQCEFRVIWPDNTVHWIQASGRSLFSDDGKPACIVGINIDVTERKLSDAALLQSEKLAAVGRMASSIAHEVNNPLEAVTNLLYLARTSRYLEEAQPYLHNAEVELSRASAITNQTLRFHKQQTRPTTVTFQQLASGIFTGQHSRLLNAKVAVQERDRARRPILCFEGEIRQVLNNLVSNAIDAMHGGGGTLFLRARNGHDWQSGRSGMVITVADTGTGLSTAASEQLFEAFYTTKGAAGNGLGLWISKDITDQHEGRLAFRSSRRAGQSGTVFTLFLPDDAADR